MRKGWAEIRRGCKYIIDGLIAVSYYFAVVCSLQDANSRN